jgi:hypothetical protein
MQRRRRLRREDPRSASLWRHSSTGGMLYCPFASSRAAEDIGSTALMALEALHQLRALQRLSAERALDQEDKAETWPALLGLA